MRRAEELDPNREQYPRVLNGVAYTLPAGRAIALLLIATELHPGLANLFDSLGEMYLKNGQRELSEGAYRRAKELAAKN